MNLEEKIKAWKIKHGALVSVIIEEDEEELQVILREPSIEELKAVNPDMSVDTETKTVKVSAADSLEDSITLFNTCVLHQPKAVENGTLLKVQAANSFMEYCTKPKKTKVGKL